MRSFKTGTVGTLAAALALAFVTFATPVPAQRDTAPTRATNAETAPAPEGMRRGQRPERPRGPNAPEVAPRGPEGPRPGPPQAGAPGPGGPVAAMVGDVVRFWERPAAVERLAITPEQVAALQASYEATRPVIDEHNAVMQKAGRVLADTMEAEGELNIEAANKAIEDFTTAQAAIMKASLEHRATVQSTLNADQLADLMQMRSRMRGPGPERGMAPTPPGLPNLPNADRSEAPRREMTPEMQAQREERLRQHEGRVRDALESR